MDHIRLDSYFLNIILYNYRDTNNDSEEKKKLMKELEYRKMKKLAEMSQSSYGLLKSTEQKMSMLVEKNEKAWGYRSINVKVNKSKGKGITKSISSTLYPNKFKKNNFTWE